MNTKTKTKTPKTKMDYAKASQALATAATLGESVVYHLTERRRQTQVMLRNKGTSEALMDYLFSKSDHNPLAAITEAYDAKDAQLEKAFQDNIDSAPLVGTFR